jgi:hypothetical protein
MLGATVVNEFSNDWIADHRHKSVVIAPDAASNFAELFKDRCTPPPHPNQGVWNVEVVQTSWLVDSISANYIAPAHLYVKGIVEIQY